MMNYNLPPDEGKKKKDLYWNVCIVLGIIAIIAFIVDANQGMNEARGEYYSDSSYYECANGERIYGQEETIVNDGIENCSDGSDERSSNSGVADICGALMCCSSLIFAISALSTKNDTQRVVVVQQQPQYVPVVQQVIQQPRVVAKSNPPATPIKNQQMWLAEAKNLELARNWEAAADAYQKAGMYEQAGKIRQEHLEQKQPVVQIGHVGNTVLNDSVMISDNSQLTCKSCGSNVEPTWKICPHCSNPL